MNIPRMLQIALAMFLLTASPLRSQEKRAPAQDPLESGISPLGDLTLPPQPATSSPSGTPTILSRASATVSVLNGEDLRSLGVRSFMDALRIVPGMEIQKISSTESSASLRSYTAGAASSQGVHGEINGRTVYNDFFGGVFWENLPVTLDDIKSIEVVRGPGSFLYGPNAMHGVINIQTRTPLDYFPDSKAAPHQIFARVEGGTYDSNSESLIFVHGDSNTAVKVKAAHDDIDDFETGADTRNKSMVQLEWETRLAPDQRLYLAAGATRQQFGTLIPTTPTAVVTIPPATFDTHSNEYFAQGIYIVGSDPDQLKIQTDWSRFDASGVPDAVYSPFSLLLDSVDLDVQYRFSPLHRHTVTSGTGVRYATFNSNDLDVTMGQHATWQTWIFLQDEVELVEERLFLTAGARLDQHSTAGTTIAPRAALVWQFAGDGKNTKGQPEKKVREDEGLDQSIRLTAGSGFQNPSLRDLWFDMPVNFGPVSGTIGGNRDLKPQELKSFEIGYWGRPNSRLQLEASTYYNRGDRLTQFQQLPSGQFARENVGHEDAYGVETNLEFQVTPEIYAFGNYAYEIRRDRDHGYERIPGGPKNKASAGVRLLPPAQKSALGAMLWATFFDESEFRDKPGPTSVLTGVPAYTLLNLRVWYPFKVGSGDGRVYLQGFNLLDHVHKEHPDGDAYGLIGSAGIEIAW